MEQATSCSPSSGCGSPNRRDSLRFTGFSAALFSPRVFVGPFEADAGLGLDVKHPVPFDKKLNAAWPA
jgi:hypothetical protein